MKRSLTCVFCLVAFCAAITFNGCGGGDDAGKKSGGSDAAGAKADGGSDGSAKK